MTTKKESALTVHSAGEMTEASVAVAVSAQWQRASDGLREIIKFGALMIKIDRDVLGATGRNQHSSKTLKGWLTDHCPEINYKTATGYRDAALGLAAAAELPDTMPLLAMMDGDDAFTDELQEAHERMMTVLGTASIGFLKAASRRGGARIGAGRPSKSAMDDAIYSTEEALRCARRLLDDMRAWALDEDGLGQIPDEVLDKWLISLGDVMTRGREIQKGRKASATARR